MKIFAVAIIAAAATGIKLDAIAERQAINLAEVEAENMTKKCANAYSLWEARKDAGIAGNDWRGINEMGMLYMINFNLNEDKFCASYLQNYGDTVDTSSNEDDPAGD